MENYPNQAVEKRYNTHIPRNVSESDLGCNILPKVTLAWRLEQSMIVAPAFQLVDALLCLLGCSHSKLK